MALKECIEAKYKASKAEAGHQKHYMLKRVRLCKLFTKNASNADGTLKWYVDGEKSFGFWAQNTCDCGNCVRVCPFNKPQGRLHDVSRKVIEHRMPPSFL